MALFVALGGGALAATHLIGPDGQIHACVTKKGKVTLVKAGHRCGKHKTAIAWNQLGPRGPQGAQGKAGPGAVKIDYNKPRGTPRAQHAVVGPWRIAFGCISNNDQFDPRMYVELWVKGPGAAEYQLQRSFDDEDPATTTDPSFKLEDSIPKTAKVKLSSSGFTSIEKTRVPETGHFDRLVGDVYLRSGASVAVLHVNMVSDNVDQSNEVCRATGAAIPTT